MYGLEPSGLELTCSCFKHETVLGQFVIVFFSLLLSAHSTPARSYRDQHYDHQCSLAMEATAPETTEWPYQRLQGTWVYRCLCTVEPRFNEVLRDWGNLFDILRVRYIELLDLTSFRKNNQNVLYI